MYITRFIDSKKFPALTSARVLTMSSFLSRFSPIPSFPAYTGPYHVGTQEIEIPVADLPTNSPTPDPDITTIICRIFYPCQSTKPKAAYWLPSPQGEYFRAYARFLSAGPRLASLLRYCTQQVQEATNLTESLIATCQFYASFSIPQFLPQEMRHSSNRLRN